MDLNSFVGSIGSVENGEDPVLTLLEEVTIGNNPNEIIVTMSGLSIGSQYDFSFGFQYEFNGGNGYLSGVTDVFSTDNTNCFDDLSMSINTNYDAGCTNVLVPVEISVPANYLEGELLNLVISTSLFEIYSDGTSSPADNMADVPFLDWININSATDPQIWQAIVDLTDLSPNTSYELEYSLVDVNGNLFLPVGTHEFSVGSSGSVNIDCDNDLQKICDVDIDINLDGTYDFCFDQIIYDGNWVFEYRLDIQDGNNVTPSQNTYNEFDPVGGEVCFENIDLSSLTEEPIIVQVVAIYNDPDPEGDDLAVNGCRLAVPVDCDQNVVAFDDITTFIRCSRTKGDNSYARICIDEGLEICDRDYTLSFRRAEGGALINYNIQDLGDGCYIFARPRPKNFCGILNYLAVLLVDGEEVASELITFDFSGCACYEPNFPKRFYMDPGNITLGDNDKVRSQLRLSTTFPQDLLDILLAERGDIPVYTAVSFKDPSVGEGGLQVSTNGSDNSRSDYFVAEEYHGTFNLKLPERTFDPKIANENYNIHVLVGDTYYELEFKEEPNEPNDRRRKEQEGLSIFPNPSNGKVSIHSDSEILQLEVIDVNGKMLKVIDKPSTQFEMDLSNYPGINFIRILTLDQSIQIRKLIIQ